MSCLAWKSRLSRCWKRGCSSIWLTAGVTPVSPMMRSRWSWLKFETPIDLIRPAFLSSISVFHASTYLSWLGSGQWIRNRSSLLQPELRHRVVEGAQRRVALMRAVAQLRCDVELGSRDACRADRRADAFFVAVAFARCRSTGIQPRSPSRLPWPSWPDRPATRQGRVEGWRRRRSTQSVRACLMFLSAGPHPALSRRCAGLRQPARSLPCRDHAIGAPGT